MRFAATPGTVGPRAPDSMPSSIAAGRLLDAVARHYGREVHAIARIPKGMGTTNWRVRTSAADYFLRQYLPDADRAGETAALRLSQEARAAGVPAPLVIPSVTGELLGAEGELAFALFEYFPDTNSGVALSCSEMAQAGYTLGRLHAFLRDRPGLRDAAVEWLAFDGRRKQAAFERYVATIERRGDRGRVRPPDGGPPAPATGAAAEGSLPPRVASAAGATGGAWRLQRPEYPVSRG